MKWSELLSTLQGTALFETSVLLAGHDSPGEVRRQLSRWVASGRLIQLRRGLYALAVPHAPAPPDLIAVASRLREPSYVSLQTALSYHGVIPESAPVVTSVTTNRPGLFETPVGIFLYRHLKRTLFWGYREVDLGAEQKAFVAIPEKALLDLYYLTAGTIGPEFIQELRLAPGRLDLHRLAAFATRAAKPKLIRAAALTTRVVEEARKGETKL